MPYTADSSIFAPRPSVTAEQCTRYILSRPHGEYTERDIGGVIVPTYFTICASVGVDPAPLIAQMIHETGNLTSWWSQRPRRNPAGIGVTGQRRPEKPLTGAWQRDDNEHVWKEGLAFASWQADSAPAHVGRLLAYALTDAQATPVQLALIKKALAYRPLTRYRGEAPTLRGLNGRWAIPGHTYAQKLAEIANTIQRVV